MLVVQRCEDLCLTLKPRNAFGIVSEVVRENLDRDVASELRVAGAIHLAHPARTKPELYWYTPIRAPGARANLRDYHTTIG